MKSKFLLTTLISIIISACGTGNDESFNQILDDEWKIGIQENPVYASSMGDKSANQDWPDISESAVRERQKKTREVLEEIRSIDPQRLSAENQLNYRLFLYNYERSVRAQKFDSHLLTFGQRGGIQLEHETAEGLSFNTSQDYKDWLVRLEKLPGLIDQHINLGRLGIEREVTAPNILMQRVANQIQLQLVDKPVDSPFFNVFKDIPVNIEDRETIQSMARDVIKNKVIPAYYKLNDFFTTEYLPASRTSFGVLDLPNGFEWYENLAKYHTTTDLTPDEIHQIGLSEVKRIRSEMQQVIDSLGFDGSFD